MVSGAIGNWHQVNASIDGLSSRKVPLAARPHGCLFFVKAKQAQLWPKSCTHLNRILEVYSAVAVLNPVVVMTHCDELAPSKWTNKPEDLYEFREVQKSMKALSDGTGISLSRIYPAVLYTGPNSPRNFVIEYQTLNILHSAVQSASAFLDREIRQLYKPIECRLNNNEFISVDTATVNTLDKLQKLIATRVFGDFSIVCTTGDDNKFELTDMVQISSANIKSLEVIPKRS